MIDLSTVLESDARRTVICLALLLVAVGSLGGCASFRGAQQRLNSDYIATYTPVCPSEGQLKAPHAGESDGVYRDRIIMVCVKAINARYAAYTDALSTESTGANLATDIVSQTLSTTASVVTKANLARALAAGSAVSIGINSAVNKDLFYKQTLPAIIASMDAKRSKVLTAIVQQQNSDRDAKTYTLARVGGDLDRYQEAGSLTTAVRELTSSAVQNAVQADAGLQVAQMDLGTAKPVTPDMATRLGAAADLVRRLEADKKDADLRTIVQSLALRPPAGASAALNSALVRANIAAVTTLPSDQQEARMKIIEGFLAPYMVVTP